jgi:hypothetical protein
MKWLKYALTGKDNFTYDAARLVGAIGAAAYVGFWFAAVFDIGHFTAVDVLPYQRSEYCGVSGKLQSEWCDVRVGCRWGTGTNERVFVAGHRFLANN